MGDLVHLVLVATFTWATVLLVGCSGPLRSVEPDELTSSSASVVENAPTPSVDPSQSTNVPSPSPSTEDLALPVRQIDADDLVTGLPTPRQLSQVQGSPWKEVSTFNINGIESPLPQWANNAPLTQKQRSMAYYEQPRAVLPERCAATAFITSTSLIPPWTKANYTHAVAVSVRVNQLRFEPSGRNKVMLWATFAYAMPPGAAYEWASNGMNMIERCKEFRVVSRQGNVSNRTVELVKSARSAEAWIQVSPSGTYSDGLVRYRIMEPIGNVLYIVDLYMSNPDQAAIQRAGKLYNSLAGGLADIQGVVRNDIDLRSTDRFRPNPSVVTQILPQPDA